MIIAINGNRHQQPPHIKAIKKLTDFLLAADHTLVLAQPFFEYLTDKIGERFALGIDSLPLNVPPRADLVLSIGGDGALLKTARWLGGKEIPVAGINTGHLGFLSAYSFSNPDDIYNHLFAGNYRIEHRSMLQIEVKAPDTEIYQRFPHIITALNELAVTRADNATMLHVEASVNGADPLDYMGDGLIISTPTGSSAYNLSVGGPILDPELQGWVLSPIAAHSLTMRPLVVNDSAVIGIAVGSRADTYRIAADGKSWNLPIGATLTVRRAPSSLLLVQQPRHTFTDTLRLKLGLGNTLV